MDANIDLSPYSLFAGHPRKDAALQQRDDREKASANSSDFAEKSKRFRKEKTLETLNYQGFSHLSWFD